MKKILGVIILTLVFFGVIYFFRENLTFLNFNKSTPNLQFNPEDVVEIPNPDLEKFEFVNLYFVVLNDQGEVGEKIGCGDSKATYPVKIEKDNNIKERTLERLLFEKNQIIDGRYYNSLANSELKLESLKIEGKKAILYLSGKLSLGGVCDNPRVKYQLIETLLQFPDIDSAEIYINNILLDELLSEKG